MKTKIEVNNLTKIYTINNIRTIKDMLLIPFKTNKRQEKIIALKNINLRIKEGESIGIIGKNGSGKTTLLKILSKIITPTFGKININGKVTSLIELGIGFSTELTGIENIYLSTSFYGLNKKNTDKIINKIIEFSELENFINLPLKYYSTGMILRLGFSIAIFLDPDILIIDEILAVGDEYFQNKCINKILELKSKKKTLIMVSHNLNLLATLSDKIIWLVKGEIKYFGNAKIAINKYINFIEKTMLKSDSEVNNYSFYSNQKISGSHITDKISLISIKIKKDIKSNKKFIIEFTIIANQIIKDIILGFSIHSLSGFLIFGTNTALHNKSINLKKGVNKIYFIINKLPLNNDIYTLSCDIHTKNYKKSIASIFKQIKFKVNYNKTDNVGPVIIKGYWKLKK